MVSLDGGEAFLQFEGEENVNDETMFASRRLLMDVQSPTSPVLISRNR